MKKSELKQLIKPIVKECINEVLLEEGLLSNVVAEVAKGLQQNVIVESQKPTTTSAPIRETPQHKHQATQSRTQLQQHRKSLMTSIGRDGYNGMDLFEGTTPMESPAGAAGRPDLGAPSDAGVDISSLVGDTSAIWQALK
jgi:hypothetical protein